MKKWVEQQKFQLGNLLGRPFPMFSKAPNFRILILLIFPPLFLTKTPGRGRHNNATGDLIW